MKMARGKYILLVEDNPDDQVLTMRALKKHNIQNEVIIVNDGEEAIEFLFGKGTWQGREITETPQLVLLDLKLPKIDGLQVLKAIRENERTRLTPVVILTTSVEDQDVIGGYNLGVNSYVRKPVDFLEFMDAVKQLGMYWLLLNESP